MEFTITLIIVIVTCLVSIGGLSNQRIIDDLIFYPPAIQRNQYYRFISHGFIHADYFHLAFNMLALYSFGQALEKTLYAHPCVFGEKAKIFFLLLYFGGLIVASIPDYIKYRNNYQYRSLGASGAVSGVIFAAITLLPQMPINFAFIPIGIPGFIFGIIYLVASAYLDKRGGGRINHSAHLWGALFGIVFTLICVKFFGQMDVYENFIKQIQSLKQFLPFEC